MNQNVGSTDRLIRIVLGLILAVVGFFFVQSALGVILGIVGLVLLVTGALSWCPLYIPFKISTRK